MADTVPTRRAARFAARRGIVLDPDGASLLSAHLSRTRRFRVTAAVVAVIVSAVSSLPQHRISVIFAWVLAGWFVGAVLATFGGPMDGGDQPPTDRPGPVWLRRVPLALVCFVLASTIICVALRPAAASGLVIVGWGVVALVVALVAAGTIGHIVDRNGPAGQPDLDRTVRANTIGAIAGGGTALAILCLLYQPASIALHRHDDQAGALHSIGVWWSIGALVLGLAIAGAGRPGYGIDERPGRPSLVPCSVVIGLVALLVAGTVIRIEHTARLDHPPYRPGDVHARATIRFTDSKGYAATEAALGIDGFNALVDSKRTSTFLGRVDVDPPKAGGEYYVVVIDTRSGRTITPLWDKNGSGWDGFLDVLPQRYPWLSALLAPGPDGFVDPEAAEMDAARGSLGITGQVLDDHGVAPTDLLVALIFVGGDQQVYWATRVPVVT